MLLGLAWDVENAKSGGQEGLVSRKHCADVLMRCGSACLVSCTEFNRQSCFLDASAPSTDLSMTCHAYEACDVSCEQKYAPHRAFCRVFSPCRTRPVFLHSGAACGPDGGGAGSR